MVSFNIDMFNFMFMPFLKLGYLWATIVLSFLVSLFTVLVNKYFTNQKEMKLLREKNKAYQQEMKKHKDDPNKVMEIQKKAMEINMKLMKHSFRPMLITFIPIMFVFMWMNVNLAYLPIQPGQNFTTGVILNPSYSGNITLNVYPSNNITYLDDRTKTFNKNDKKLTWNLKADKGNYILEYDVVSPLGKDVKKQELIIDKEKYSPAIVNVKEKSAIKQMFISYKQNRFFPFKIFGWRPGWLGTYILSSLLFSIILRKLLDVQ